MHQIEVDGVIVTVVRKDIKNLHLAVYPPDGRVRVAAPLRFNDEAVRRAVLSRLGWIRRHQQKFQQQERLTVREYVSGESHYFMGRRYRLNVIEQDGAPKVELRNKQYIDLYVRPGSGRDQRRQVMVAWYRRELRKAIPAVIEKWEKVIGVSVNEWGIRQMKTRWGSCNVRAKRIWINLEIAAKPPACLEYIVVHEMTHLLERLHNERFYALMTRFMPQWRSVREELNRQPLSHDKWEED